MTETAIRELDCVTLNDDLPEHGLEAGAMGAVVAIYGGGSALEVEFIDSDGDTLAVVTIEANKVHPVQPARLARELQVLRQVVIRHDAAADETIRVLSRRAVLRAIERDAAESLNSDYLSLNADYLGRLKETRKGFFALSAGLAVFGVHLAVGGEWMHAVVTLAAAAAAGVEAWVSGRG